ncbi:MAG TPA: SRPBCC domain-containing protein [Ramlibacter sp.]|jgi:uncharacterized protein YndB with AHSA1/START domain
MKFLVVMIALLLACAAGAAERAIDREVIVPANVDQVWQAWTTSEGIKTFFAPDANVQLRVDGPFEVFINPYAKPGMKGADGMRIIGFQDRKMLSFTWNAPPHLPQARANRSIVILRFEPAGENQTKLTLHHVGWGDGGEWDQAFDYFSKAWPNVLASLQQRFTTGPVDWTEWLQKMKAMQ